jgi:hypothetical protein
MKAMNHSDFYLAVIRQRASDADARAQMLGPILAARRDEPASAAPEPLTVRLAVAADWPALTRVAELDSAILPGAPMLVAERDGRLLAALSLSDHAVVADPFVPTADVVALLELRARQIRRDRRRGPGRALAWRPSRAGS